MQGEESNRFFFGMERYPVSSFLSCNSVDIVFSISFCSSLGGALVWGVKQTLNQDPTERSWLQGIHSGQWMWSELWALELILEEAYEAVASHPKNAYFPPWISKHSIKTSLAVGVFIVDKLVEINSILSAHDTDYFLCLYRTWNLLYVLFPHQILMIPGFSTSHKQSLWVLETQLLTCNMHPVSLNHSAEACCWVVPAHQFLVGVLEELHPSVQPANITTGELPYLLPLDHCRLLFFSASCAWVYKVYTHFQMLNTRLQSQFESSVGQLLLHQIRSPLSHKQRESV